MFSDGVSATLLNQDLLEVPSQPHSGEVAPSQLPDDVVSPIKEISYFHKVITP